MGLVLQINKRQDPSSVAANSPLQPPHDLPVMGAGTTTYSVGRTKVDTSSKRLSEKVLKTNPLVPCPVVVVTAVNRCTSPSTIRREKKKTLPSSKWNFAAWKMHVPEQKKKNRPFSMSPPQPLFLNHFYDGVSFGIGHQGLRSHDGSNL